MKSFLDKHNKMILKKHTNRLNKDDEKLCNCRQRMNCPTDGKCLTRSVVYKAEVTSTDANTTQRYMGVPANDFKSRHKSFKIPTQRKVQERNGLIQTRLESKKRKSAIFDQKKKWSALKRIITSERLR